MARSTSSGLTPSSGDDNCFFAFADTVVARSFRGGNECHGWMGVKFQAQQHDEPSQIVMHVRMLDVEAWASSRRRSASLASTSSTGRSFTTTRRTS